jgi:hypothetical protein
MRLRQNEILAATAVAMYIVFFSTSPPDVIRMVLANPVGMVAVFGAALYVTLKWSKVVGGLLIVAFVLSMTRVTEHMTPASELAAAQREWDSYVRVGFNESNAKDNLAAKAALDRLNALKRNAGSTPSGPASAPSGPASAQIGRASCRERV